jgi:hypothetical protein
VLGPICNFRHSSRVLEYSSLNKWGLLHQLMKILQPCSRGVVVSAVAPEPALMRSCVLLGQVPKSDLQLHQ